MLRVGAVPSADRADVQGRRLERGACVPGAPRKAKDLAAHCRSADLE
jgi:hypothetical protein